MKPSITLYLWVFLSPSLVAATSAALGDTVCVEGFVMDTYCINLGVLLDNPGVKTLEGPGNHSYHCILDESVCRESNYTILKEPQSAGGLYSVAYQVDDAGKSLLIDLGRKLGQMGSFPACSSCTGEGSLLQGFRAEVTGIVTDLGNGTDPPKINVTSALSSNGRTNFCSGTQLAPSIESSNAPNRSPPSPANKSPVGSSSLNQITSGSRSKARSIMSTLFATALCLATNS